MSDEVNVSRTHTPARRTARPGRNAPCWCGSGKKYKRCHLDAEERVANALDDVGGPGGTIALSAALLEIGGGLFEELEDPHARKNFADIVAAAWNLEILERQGDVDAATGLRDGLAMLDEDGVIAAMLGGFVSRKRELFPGDDRMVTRVEMMDGPRGPRLVVASVAPRDGLQHRALAADSNTT